MALVLAFLLFLHTLPWWLHSQAAFSMTTSTRMGLTSVSSFPRSFPVHRPHCLCPRQAWHIHVGVHSVPQTEHQPFYSLSFSISRHDHFFRLSDSKCQKPLIFCTVLSFSKCSLSPVASDLAYFPFFFGPISTNRIQTVLNWTWTIAVASQLVLVSSSLNLLPL